MTKRLSIPSLRMAVIVAPLTLALLMGAWATEKERWRPSQPLSERFKVAIQQSGLPERDLGLWVDRRKGEYFETEFALNDSKPFIPASLSKLVTAAAILHSLEATVKFKTQIALPAGDRQLGSTLSGPLYLVGGGDPSFVSESMWLLVNQLARAGVTQVDGDIIVDDSRFDSDRIYEERKKQRVDDAYDAPVGAMSMNWNSVNIYVRPGKQPGSPALVIADPPSGYIRLRNLAVTGSPTSSSDIEVERISERGFIGDVIVVRGEIAKGHPEMVRFKNITRPDLWSGFQLLEFLKQRGITIQGRIRTGILPKDATVLASLDSKPIFNIVEDMTKWSNNFVAEMLVKDLAAEKGQVPASMKSGLREINLYLGKIGWAEGSYDFVSPSGFTLKNHVSAAQLGRLLEKVREDFTIFPEYLAALPIAGVDGTLKNRMRDSSATRWVRAKTGFLDGAVGLAGFAGHPDGSIQEFVFLYNGSGHEGVARALFDRLAVILAEG